MRVSSLLLLSQYTHSIGPTHFRIISLTGIITIRIIHLRVLRRYLVSAPAIAATAQPQHRSILFHAYRLAVARSLVLPWPLIGQRLRGREAADFLHGAEAGADGARGQR